MLKKQVRLCFLKVDMSEMSRRYCGSAFHSLGSAMLDARLPATVDRVNGTHSRLCSRERMPLDGAYLTRFNKIAIQGTPQMAVD